MLSSYALTTVVRTKQFLGISSSSDDAIIEALINAVTDQIEKYCNRRFKKTTYTDEEYDGLGGNTLLLRNYPVDLTSFALGVRDTNLNEADWSAINAQDYFVALSAGVVSYVNGGFFPSVRRYRATYSAGYDFNNTTTFLSDVGAADLELAAWKMVGRQYFDRRGNSSVKQESIGDYSVTYDRSAMFDEQILSILDLYKRPLIG